MKLFVYSSVETSDDDEDEEVSAEESQGDSDEGEEEADSDESDGEEQASDNTDNEKESGTENTAGKLTNKNADNSEASSTTEVDTLFKGVNGTQKINGIKEEQLLKGPEFNIAKSPSKTKPMANGVSLPARLKNVSTEIMVLAAIRSLNERGGSSAIAIKKYVMNNYPQLDGPRTMKLIKAYIKKALVSGKLVQSKGTGLGGSFKVSPGTNRLEEQKERQNRKKLVKKPKSDQAADKVKKPPKAAAKKIEKGEIKSAKEKKAKAKGSKSAIKLKDGSESTTKMPKISVALKASDPLPAKKTTKTKEAKVGPLANAKPAKKTKGAEQYKAQNVESTTKKTNKNNNLVAPKSATAITKEEKGKTATTSKKKAIAKGKATAMENVETGSGDAYVVKPNKKTAAKKVKTK
ncbi:histone H1-I-like [Bactrocera neohumeralis]|uniref:histone H1-I-like n=1 Tax=Bactrocera neohumeralis TaxID=98809 RepID=UPI0021651626|nr:histone H1-I-like [Bactrocera neohumeralis]